MDKTNNQKKYQSVNMLKKLLLYLFLKKIKNIILQLKIKNIIDAGCGEGYTISYLKKFLSPKIKFNGFDVSEKCLAIANEKIKGWNSLKGNIYNIPFKKNSSDLVLALEVLEHLKSPEIALKELQRVTKKYCLISVPLEPFFSLSNLTCGKNIKSMGKDNEHLQFWNKKQIVNLIQRHFNILSVKISFPWTIILAKK